MWCAGWVRVRLCIRSSATWIMGAVFMVHDSPGVGIAGAGLPGAVVLCLDHVAAMTVAVVVVAIASTC